MSDQSSLPQPGKAPRRVTNFRDDKTRASTFWRESFEQRRCLVPVTSFAEPREITPATWHWFALQGEVPRPLFAFAGIWRRWSGPIKKDGQPVDLDVFSFMTTLPNVLVTTIMAEQAKAVMQTETLEAVADRGYFKGEEILACEEAGITVTLPKPMTSGAKSAGRYGKQDFVYMPGEDVYRCPAGEKLQYRFTGEEDGQKLHSYWTSACKACPLKAKCTTGPERRVKRWEHEHVVEAVQARLDKNPSAMRVRRETVEHPFGTLKMRMGATHFLVKTLPKVATEMALCVLGYNLTRVLNIVGVDALLAAVRG